MVNAIASQKFHAKHAKMWWLIFPLKGGNLWEINRIKTREFRSKKNVLGGQRNTVSSLSSTNIALHYMTHINIWNTEEMPNIHINNCCFFHKLSRIYLLSSLFIKHISLYINFDILIIILCWVVQLMLHQRYII